MEDDGDNFGGIYRYADILKVTGAPPNQTEENLTDFEGYDFRVKLTEKLLLRFFYGLVAFDSAMYVCLYDYDWEIKSKPVNLDW